MALFTFHVTPDGGETFDLAATSRDVLNWEKTTKGASLGKFENEPSLVDIYKIAHFAAIRTQRFTGSLAEFEQSHDIEFDSEEDSEPEDPTPPARSRARSSRSR